MYWGGINSGVSCQRKHFNLVKLYGRLAVTIRVRESGGGMRENEATFQFVEAAFLLQRDPNVLLIPCLLPLHRSVFSLCREVFASSNGG